MRRLPSWRVGAAVLAVLLAVVLGIGGYALGRSSTRPPAEGVDAGFARDMQTHHRQAVEMSFIIRDKTEDPALQTLTYDIINGQAHQAGQMYGWLAAWGYSQNSTEPPMEWMAEFGHGHSGEPDHGASLSPAEAEAAANESMGMATPEEMTQLREIEGVEAEKLFLRLMLEHHHGGIEMAQLTAEHAEQPEVRTLAGAIVAAQTAEAKLLEDLLAARS
jgi:uncharacterized protein (DUF305 family)